jgi:hypothetical protein
MNRFENFGWLWIAVSITDLVMAVIRQSVIASSMTFAGVGRSNSPHQKIVLR